MCFTKLEVTESELLEIGENRHIKFHCDQIITIKDGSVLSSYIKRTHEMPLKDQKQIPNLEVIERDAILSKDERQSSRLLNDAKIVVLTSYATLAYNSYSNSGKEQNPLTECWYPTIYFYDL